MFYCVKHETLQTGWQGDDGMVDEYNSFLKQHQNNKGFLLLYRTLKVWLNLFYPVYARLAPRRGLDPNADFVVSLTSFPARIGTTHLVIETLMRQRVRPRAILLWLAEEQFPEKKLPRRLTRLERFGLSIRWCEDLKSHKKYYYTMREFPELTVITADDDMFYPESWTEKLVETADAYPDLIVCYKAERARFGSDGNILPYDDWDDAVDADSPAYDLVPIGYKGILYPPHSLAQDVFDKDFFMVAECRNDDLWLKTMSLVADSRVVVAEGGDVPYITLFAVNKDALYKINVNEKQNDVQLKRFFARYGDAWLRLKQKDT